jgi:dUTP pyrophosphatase
MPNAPATIDSDYRGEIRVPLINLGRAAFTITRGMRIAQLVVGPVMHVVWVEVPELPPSVRSGRGFGHSGL